MKPYLFALASCGALLLSGCKGSVSTVKQPAWVDAQPCQKELPELVDYTKDAPLGNEKSVVVVVRGEGGTMNLYVVEPGQGTVAAGYKVQPNDYVELNMGDRITGGLTRPSPPPPPGGWDRLRDIIGVASRVSRSAPEQCMAGPPMKDIGNQP